MLKCGQCGWSPSFMQWAYAKSTGSAVICPNCHIYARSTSQQTQQQHFNRYPPPPPPLGSCTQCGAPVYNQGAFCVACLSMHQQAQVNNVCRVCSLHIPAGAAACPNCLAAIRTMFTPYASAVFWAQGGAVHVQAQVQDEPEPEPDEWELLTQQAREAGLTQEDIDFAMKLKRAGITYAEVALLEAIREKLRG